jgi:hypothetical protein
MLLRLPVSIVVLNLQFTGSVKAATVITVPGTHYYTR